MAVACCQGVICDLLISFLSIASTANIHRKETGAWRQNMKFYDWTVNGKSSSYVAYMYIATCIKLFLLCIPLLESSGVGNAAE